jgi:hypothetical protein
MNSRGDRVKLRQEHRQALKSHAIELLRLGYGKLDAVALSSVEEEYITGKLKEAIESIIEVDRNAPPWVERYTVYDEEKPSGTPQSGKKRPRIDITIKRLWRLRESHPRFRFEAKRLKADRRVSPYFGKEGIGCFLRGKYPLTHPEAAMVGYVQAGTATEWQQRLGAYAQAHSRRLKVVTGGDWQSYNCCIPYSSVTEHSHPQFPRLVMVHLLLMFCALDAQA